MRDLNRLKYTITNRTKPNDQDLEAINNLEKYISDLRSKVLNKNDLFAKLFINVLKNDLINSKGNYQSSIETLRMALKIDLATHYELFKSEINAIELEKYCDHLGIPSEINTIEDEQLKENVLNENVDELTRLLDRFTNDQVKKRLDKLMINIIEDEN